MNTHRLVAVLVLSATIYFNAGQTLAAEEETEPSEPVEAIVEIVDLQEVSSILLVAKEKIEFPDRSAEAKAAAEEAAKPPPRIEHVIESGDTLDSIAQENQTNWPRLFDANPHIADPNVITVGEKISIPRPEEQIAPRAPQPPQPEPEPIATTTAVATAPVRQLSQQNTVTTRVSIANTGGGLVGSVGYARWSGNCVNEPGVNNPRNGNPSAWPATSGTPWIGATALFHYNHVGVVTGIWANGDLEIRHQNFKGNQTRFPRSAFRGFR